ncbi:MAG TPA: transketolase [Anaerolineales bacterium]|nr:transketolase [Anaerolineales bacterium]
MSDMDTRPLAKAIRAHALRMVYLAGSSHIGSCLSIADLLAVLYGRILRLDPGNPNWAERDRFILSKGHAAAIYYAVLAERGFFPKTWLDNFGQDGAQLGGHVTSHGVPGVELSTGALGHGLSVGCGMALAGKRENRPYRIFVILSDGELDEGSNWESILFAPHHQLDNLVAIVDYNKIQSFGTVSEVLNLNSLNDKWQAFGWSVHEVDGHDHIGIAQILENLPVRTGKPNVVIAHTIKGKGVSFMEDRLEWHYKSPDREQLDLALSELGIEP